MNRKNNFKLIILSLTISIILSILFSLLFIFGNLDNLNIFDKANYEDEVVSWGSPFPLNIKFYYEERQLRQDGILKRINAKWGKSTSIRINKDTWWILSEGLEKDLGFRSSRDYSFTMLCGDAKEMSIKSRPGYWVCSVMSHDSSVPVDVYINEELVFENVIGGETNTQIKTVMIRKSDKKIFNKIADVDALEGF